MSDDPAYVLFPNDAPAASKPPDWYHVQRDTAEARLSGRHGATTQDDAAARLFPSEAPKAEAQPPAGAGVGDPAKALFGKDAASFDEKPAAEFFEGFAMSATSDGDMERAQALRGAGEALIADAKAAGTDAADLAEALDIVRERQGDTLAGSVPAEKLEADKSAGLAALAAEGVSDADIRAAQRFVADLELVAPGTIDSLTATGAGNDLRLIRKAIAEARRRGY